MLLPIDPLSPAPIAEQIAFGVKGAIARGELAAGDRLPSVRELAREATVNPNTVVRAYERLERDGIIVRRQGAGCFVTGRTSELREGARREQLAGLLERAVTEAFHLGFRERELREAFDAALRGVRFPDGPKGPKGPGGRRRSPG
jgi:GntR family transcriptional regulator